MELRPEDFNNVAAVLECHAQKQTVAVKQAIRDYNQMIRAEADSNNARKLEKRREVERAVSQYIQIQKRLERLRFQIQAGNDKR